MKISRITGLYLTEELHDAYTDNSVKKEVTSVFYNDSTALTKICWRILIAIM